MDPADRRMMISSGPFNMQPGDVQDIVFAIIGANSGETGDNLLSLAQLQKYVPVIRQFYEGLTDFIPPEGALQDTLASPAPEHQMFILGQNYPNPFNNTTTIRFKIYGEMNVKVDIYNNLGQKIKSIFEGKRSVREHFFDWDGTNDQGLELSSGVYFIRLTNGVRTQIKKTVYLR